MIFYINNTGAAVNPIVHLHCRRRSGVVFFINSSGGSSETPSFIFTADGVSAWSSS